MSMEIKEAQERGDIAKSLQELIRTQFMSKRFYDIVGSTRFSKRDVYLFSMLEMERVKMKILSLSEIDTKAEGLSDEERREVKELYELKKRFHRNPNALGYAITDAIMYMFSLGLQSLDGMSRYEGVQIAGGSVNRIMNPENMSFFDKARKRLTGKVLFTE